MRPSSAATALGLALAIACSPPDPMHDRAVERLGDEIGAADEFHRAGQPCGTCHDAKSNGPANTDFSVAGTVFATASSLVAVPGVRIELTDSAGTSPPPALTNCAGNFWVPRSTWDPVLPITAVKMTKDTTARAMLSPIGGTASCADCHQPRPSDPLAKLGAVFLYDGPTFPSSPPCSMEPKP